jgi:hypothetical protein
MATVVTVVEVDVPICSLTYGVAPCTAELGVTGPAKCFNTLATCQDRENFDRTVLTMRFFRPSSEPEVFDGFAVLRDVQVTPQLLDPGNSIGQRETVRVTLNDFQHSDAGFDKYLADRGYDAFTRGTFWGRFRARVPAMRGAALRVLRGYTGQPLSTFEVWHYVVETTTGPANGGFQITGKDALKLASGDRAQAPRPSQGLLSTELEIGESSLTLTPAGIGATYPASGRAAIGGSELVQFTRSGDDITLTSRGDSGTEETDHVAGARFQLVLEYNAQRPDAIIADLLLSYTEVDASWVDTVAWQAEIEAFTPRLYSALIAEPTPVDRLINELVSQVGLVMWTDTRAQQLRLIGLRAVGADAAVFDGDRNMVGSFTTKEQPGKRVSQSWTYYGMRNPLEPADDPQNFACIAVGVDATGADEEYGGEAIRTTFSRWINAFNRQAAEQVNAVLLARYRDPPRALGWSVFITDDPPQVGAGAYIKHRDLQDATGAEVQVPVQVTSLEALEDRYKLTGEQQPSVAPDIITSDKVVYIDANGYNLNLRTIYDSVYEAPDAYDEVTFIVAAGVVIGTREGGNKFAITSGSWPELLTPPKLRILGRVMGRGGNGGTEAGGGNGNGFAGEHALQATQALRVENLGTIGGGGGGGGGGGLNTIMPDIGGGGGQGFEGGLGAPGGNGWHQDPLRPGMSRGQGQDGTADEPGWPGRGGASSSYPFPVYPDASWAGGRGGTLGQPGGQGRQGGGGAAGIAVHGDDLIVWEAEGTILGARLDSGDPVP